MAFKVLNRVPLQNELRPSQIKETTVTIQDQSPFTQYTRTLDGDWRNDTDNAVIDEVLEVVFKDTFAGRYESEKITGLENRVLKSSEEHQATVQKVDTLQKNLTVEIEKVNQLVNTIIHAEDLTAAQKELILSQHPVYQIGQYYNVGDVINYNSELYEVVQEHTAQGDWIPDEAPALYTPVKNTEYEDEEGNEIKVIQEFVQPTGAHDVYQLGDKVIYRGDIYESLVDNNANTPDDFPTGWELIESNEEQEEVLTEEEINEEAPAFTQPTGADDAYKKGDKVLFNGTVYQSLIDNNVYSPSDYAQGWEVI